MPKQADPSRAPNAESDLLIHDSTKPKIGKKKLECEKNQSLQKKKKKVCGFFFFFTMSAFPESKSLFETRKSRNSASAKNRTKKNKVLLQSEHSVQAMT